VVEVVFQKMPEGVHGRTDGVTIFVAEGLNARQLLCTVAHEMVHVERGHSTRQLESEEMSVRYETSRRLVQLDRLIRTCSVEGRPLSARARELGVTKRVLMDRAATLGDEQARRVGCFSCQQCPAISARAERMVEH
jgi:hypothetical protein